MRTNKRTTFCFIQIPNPIPYSYFYCQSYENSDSSEPPIDEISPYVVSSVFSGSNTLTITFNESVYFGFNNDLPVLSGDSDIILTYISGGGTSSFIYSSDRIVYNTETLSLAYDQPGDGIQDSSGNLLQSFSGFLTTNNSSEPLPDLIAPTIESIIFSGLNILTIIFDENIIFGADTNLPILSSDSSSVPLTYISGSGTTELLYFSNRTILNDENLTLDYTQLGDGIQDESNNLLVSFSSLDVVNNGSQSPDTTAPTLISSVFSGSNTVTLTFDESVVFGADADVPVLTSNGDPIILSFVSGTGANVLIYATNRVIFNDEILSISYTQPGDGIQDSSGNLLENISTYTTLNNGDQEPDPGDITPPVLVFSTFSGSNTLTLNFNESVTFGTDANVPTLSSSGAAISLTFVSGDSSSVFVFSTSRVVYDDETLSLGYTQPGDGIQDLDGNLFASISTFSTTNNSTESVTPEPDETAMYPSPTWNGTAGSGGSAPSESSLLIGSGFEGKVIAQADIPKHIWLEPTDGDLRITVATEHGDDDWVASAEFIFEGTSRLVTTQTQSARTGVVGFGCTIDKAAIVLAGISGETNLYVKIRPVNGYERVIGPYKIALNYAGGIIRQIVYTDWNNGNNAWDGSSPVFVSGIIGPKKTIGDSMRISSNGGIISAAAGTYLEDSNSGSSAGTAGHTRLVTVKPRNLGDAVTISRTSRNLTPSLDWRIQAKLVEYRNINFDCGKIGIFYGNAPGGSGGVYIFRECDFTDTNGVSGPYNGYWNGNPLDEMNGELFRTVENQVNALINCTSSVPLISGSTYCEGSNLTISSDSFFIKSNQAIFTTNVTQVAEQLKSRLHLEQVVTITSATYDSGTGRTTALLSGSPTLSTGLDGASYFLLTTGANAGSQFRIPIQLNNTTKVMVVEGDISGEVGSSGFCYLTVHADFLQAIESTAPIILENILLQKVRQTGATAQLSLLQMGTAISAGGNVTTVGNTATFSVAQNLLVNQILHIASGPSLNKYRRIKSITSSTIVVLESAFSSDITAATFSIGNSVKDLGVQLCVFAKTSVTPTVGQWSHGLVHIVYRQSNMIGANTLQRNLGSGYGLSNTVLKDSIWEGLAKDSGSTFPTDGIFIDNNHFINPSYIQGTNSSSGPLSFTSDYHPLIGELTNTIPSPKLKWDMLGNPLALDGSDLVGAVQLIPITPPPSANLLARYIAGTGVTSSGGKISQWNDQSGNNYHATQAVSANQPFDFLDFDGLPIVGLPVKNGQNSPLAVSPFFNLPAGLNIQNRNCSIWIIASQYENNINAATIFSLGATYNGGPWIRASSAPFGSMDTIGGGGKTGTILLPLNKGLIGAVSGPSNVKIYNQTQSETLAVSTLNSSYSGGAIGRYAFSSSSYGKAGIYEVLIYSGVQGPTEIDAVRAYAFSKYGIRNTPYTKRVIFRGDSKTDGNGISDGLTYPRQCMNYLGETEWQAFEFGTSGNTFADAVSGNAFTDALYDSSLERCVLVFEYGTNDLSATGGFQTPSQVYASAVSYATARLAAGFEVYVCCSPSSICNQVNGYNDYLRGVVGNGIVIDVPGCKLIDQCADSRLATFTNQTYFNADQVHENNEGSRVKGQIVATSILTN